MLIIETEFDLLQTTNWSVDLGKRWIEFTHISVVAVPPNDLNVPTHSVVLMFHILTVPSELALSILCVSTENTASLTKLLWPTNSLISLPDFRPWIRIVQSKEAVRSWLESFENEMQVTPLLCAFSYLLKHWPVCIFHTCFFLNTFFSII